MFSPPIPQNRGRWTYAQLASFAIHCFVLFFLVRQPEPMFIQPTSVMAGMGGSSTAVVYLPSNLALGERTAAEPHHALVAPVHRPKPHKAPPPMTAKAEGESTRGDDARVTLAGSPYGSLGNGPVYGHEIRPALPTVFPDPVVSSSQLPRGVAGTVVIQVTIDAQGAITETKVLKSLGYGVEERVLAALQGWRFRPATQDGVAIPSQQYMYFHFPS